MLKSEADLSVMCALCGTVFSKLELAAVWKSQRDIGGVLGFVFLTLKMLNFWKLT